jgi:VWFA-related protein
MRVGIDVRLRPAGRRIFLRVAILAAALTPVVSAQQGGRSEPQQPSSTPTAAGQEPGSLRTSGAPTLRVMTRLVQVSVIVSDKHGNPVTGLKKDDFLVLDNKKPREIQVFVEELNGAAPVGNSALAPETFTNRPEEQAGHFASVSVILLDTLNTEFGDQALAQKQVLKFLDTVQAHDHIALYWLGSDGLRVLHEFTTDPGTLRETLAKFRAEASARGADVKSRYISERV